MNGLSTLPDSGGRPIRMNKQILLFAATGLILTGCATERLYPEQSPMDNRVFRGDWFDYYNRAMRNILAGEADAAEPDLRMAVSLRPRDSHHARTYGVHYQRYYPHRELGVIMYHRGDFPTAESELLQSLTMAPTSKAEYFLNETRRKRLRASGLDRQAPSISVEFPPDDYVTNQRELTITGTVSDDTFAERVIVGEEDNPPGLAAARLPFSTKVRLSRGLNRIPILAFDLAGRSTERQVAVFVDCDGPSLGLDLVRVVEGDSGRTAEIRGAVLDNSTIDQLRVNAVPLEAGTKRVSIDGQFDLAPGQTSIEFLVGDECGNESRGQIPLKGPDGDWRTSSASAHTRPRLVCGDGEIAFRLAMSLVSATTRPIELSVRTPPKVVYTDTYPIVGSAHDARGIERITANGQEVHIRPALHVYFSHLISLQEGANSFTVSATTEDGRSTSKELTVERRLPAALQVANRLCVSTAMNTIGSALSELETETLRRSFISELGRNGRFRVLERRDLERILQEQGIATSSLIERTFPPRLAEILPTDLLIDLDVIGDPDGIDIYASVLDVDNPYERTAFDIYHPRDEDLKRTSKGLYVLLENEFPFVQGKILDVRRNKVTTSLNRPDHRVRPNRLLYVFREGEVITKEGTDYGKRLSDVGRLCVETVDERKSTAAVEDLVDGNGIRESDIVVTE